MAWVRPEGIQNPYSAIFCLESDVTAALNFQNNNELGYHWLGGSWSWNSGLIVNKDEWNHVALVANDNSISLFVNGKKAVHSIDANEINFNKIIRLCSYKNWTDRNYSGLIDEVSFWNVSLSDVNIYNSVHKSLNGNEDGLLAYFQFDRRNTTDAISGFNGYSNSGSLNYIESTTLIGESVVSINKEIGGNVHFDEVGIDVNYSTQNGSEVFIAKFEIEPNTYAGIDESFDLLNEQYWIYHRFSDGGIYLGDISFNLIDLHAGSAYDLPENYKLYNRSEGSDGNWKFIKNASNVDQQNNILTFESIFATGQFLLVKYENITKIEVEDGIPEIYTLSQNYPNPFNPSTTIKFGLPNDGKSSMKIYGLLGNQIKVLVNDYLSAGYHSVTWDGTNTNGNKVVSGIYIYEIISGTFNKSKKLILLK